jgi:7-cyano-7-deazaguanine tRNA-ribosyltransferase
MTFALAAALGCDLFDSAAYALYARDDRYLTVRGTDRLDDLEYFPCACPACGEWTPAELRDRPERERGEVLAEHNLHVSFAEMRRVKGAIREGNLLELVEARARGHPTLLDGYRALLEHPDTLEATDPVSKGTFFHLSAESARRPEVRRHHDRLARLEVGDEVVVGGPSGDDGDGGESERWLCRPPFGPLPPALKDAYPLTTEVPDRLEPQAFEAAAEGVRRLAAANPETTVRLVHDGWPRSALERLPDGVRAERQDTGKHAPEGDE